MKKQQTSSKASRRAAGDFYPTPEPTIDAIISWLPFSPSRVLDWCAGTGNIARRVAQCSPHLWVSGVEGQSALADQARQRVPHGVEIEVANVLDRSWQDRAIAARYDVIVGNPPYLVAAEHVDAALRVTVQTQGRVIFLLRLGFLGSQERYDAWTSRWPGGRTMVLSVRPSFISTKKSTTDSSEYAWFEFDHRRSSSDRSLHWYHSGIKQQQQQQKEFNFP